MKKFNLMERNKSALLQSQYDVIVLFGADHIQYVSGAIMPFIYSQRDLPVAILWSKAGEPICVCPKLWESSFQSAGWIGDTRTYIQSADNEELFLELVKSILQTVSNDTVVLGIDMERVSGNQFDFLSDAFPKAKWVACDEWIRDLRMVKTPEEIELLVDLAERTDHAIAGSSHHVAVLGSKTEKFFHEDLRVHGLERWTDVIGYNALSQVASGERAKTLWPIAPRFNIGDEKQLQPGEMARLELKTNLDGYWIDAGRMLTMGIPSEEQSKVYNGLTIMRDFAIELLKPGITFADVYNKLNKKAQEIGLDVLSELGFGHSIGVTPCEAPYINGSDQTKIASGMVLTIDVAAKQSTGEIMRLKDTVVISDNGSEIVGWYQDWRAPYIAAVTF